MYKFDIVTIFPEVVTPYLNASILKRAQEKRLAKMAAHDLRKWTKDKHRTVDDSPYGGGAGMVMKVEPLYRAVKALGPRPESERRGSVPPGPRGTDPPMVAQARRKHRTRVLLTSAAGKPFTQKRAEYYAKRYDQLIIICGRYEGVDHRVAQHIADEEVSVGPYVLTGGELPALTIVDAVTRLIPGVIRPESLAEESFSFAQGSPPEAGAQLGDRGIAASQIGEYPQYTRPEVFYPDEVRGSPERRVLSKTEGSRRADPKNKKKAWRVPKILLEGNHAKIQEWRLKHRRGTDMT